MWSHEERYNQKRTCERISKSSTSDNEDHREKAKVVKGRRARTTKNVRCTSTRKRQKTRWKDTCNRDVESVGLKEEENALDRTNWKNFIQYRSGDTRLWEKPEERRRILSNTAQHTWICDFVHIWAIIFGLLILVHRCN